jgi:hypothetical protein
MYSQPNFDSTAPEPSRQGSNLVVRRAGQRLENSLIRPVNKLAFSAFGVGFALSADTGDILQDCLQYLPPGWTRTSSECVDAQYSVTHHPQSVTTGRGMFGLAKNGRELFRCSDRTEFLERFGSIVALHVADNSRKLVFIHAGVVGWGDQAIVIPGRSFSGKTTLVAELVRAGATYYSDEFAVVDRHGRVHPYPRPLQIREGRTYRQTCCPVESLGGIAAETPLPIGVVIFSRYQEGASWLPQELSPGIGCLRMLDNTISARSAPAIALTTLKRVASRAVAVSGLRGDTPQIIQWIIANFSHLQSRSTHSA